MNAGVEMYVFIYLGYGMRVFKKIKYFYPKKRKKEKKKKIKIHMPVVLHNLKVTVFFLIFVGANTIIMEIMQSETE